MAARRKQASEAGIVRFLVVPRVRWVFGSVAQGAVDSRALIEGALRFANGEDVPIDPTPGQVLHEPLLQGDNLQKTRESWRTALRQFLGTFRTKPAAAIRSLPEYSLAIHGISGIARFEDGRAHFEITVPVNSPEEFRTLLALTLADDAQPFGRALCRCRLKSCGRFFLEQKPRTGRPQRLYCSREHMLAAHAARER